jgi:hypothetical protein
MNTRARMEWNQKMKLRVYRGVYTERSDREKKRKGGKERGNNWGKNSQRDGRRKNPTTKSGKEISAPHTPPIKVSQATGPPRVRRACNQHHRRPARRWTRRYTLQMSVDCVSRTTVRSGVSFR